MYQYSSNSTDLSLSLAGPLAIGAILGLGGVAGAGQVGVFDVMHTALLLPLILVGVTAAMIPALYIATSLADAAPPAREVGVAVMRGFRSCGLALLGLAGPVAFLLATTESSDMAAFLGALVITGGVFAGLRVLFADLFGELVSSATVRFVFTIWAVVSLAIGARMYQQFMVG